MQTEKTLMGYGKPLPESKQEVSDELTVKKLRQAPCDEMVIYSNYFICNLALNVL